MDRMSPLDASFLHVEDAVSHMHIGSVAVFEGPPPAAEDFARMVQAKLPAVPRYRQKVRFVPLQLGRPVWVDDPHFQLGYHLRHSALAAPGRDRELRNLVGRVMSQQLDRHKPLWEMWIVEGLEHNHWALVSKVHHCMVDGISGTDLLTVVLDAEPEPARPLPDTWHPATEPGTTRLVRDAARRSRRQPVRADPRPAFGDACAPPGDRPARRARTRAARLDRRRSADRSVVDQRPDRPPSQMGLGPHDTRRCEDRPACPGRNRQRRRPDRAHPRLSRPARRPRRKRRRSCRTHPRSRVGANRRRTRHLQQSRFGDDRGAPGRPR